jgi:hypothetical protein
MMGLRFGKVTGVVGMGDHLGQETLRDVLRASIKVADKMVAHAKRILSARGDGPSRPGQPPAMHEGMLVDGIGRTEGAVNRGAAFVAWGFGVGRDALRRMEAHAARRGEPLGNMFAIGLMNEYGSVSYALARSHPQRPFIRPTEEALKAEAIADIERALGVR